MGGGGAGGAIDELVAFDTDENCGDELLIADIIGGGGGGIGAAGIVGEADAPSTNDCDGDVGSWTVGARDCFRFGLEMSPRQCGHVNFWMLGVRSSRVESSRFSRSVARWTSVSAVSHMMSLIASFGSMRSRCCRMLRKGYSCGVSAT